MKPSTSGGGWAAVRYTLRMANRVGWLPLWRAMRSQERLQDLRAGHGRAGGRHGQRGRPLPGGVQEVAAGHGRRHAGGHLAGLLRALLHRRSCGRCRRASWNGCGRLIEPLYAGAGTTRTTASSAGTRRWTALAATADRPAVPAAASSTPAAARRTRPASCCNCSRACSAPTTSTTAPTTATRRAASGWTPALGHRHRDGAARGRREQRSVRSASAATRRRTTRG